MKNINVEVINESHSDPAGMMMFVARLTQRGHNIKTMNDLKDLYDESLAKHTKAGVTAVANLPHGSIKRYTPITIAIVGASRRFLAQARTHQVGFNYTSASLQYSNYTGAAQFVIPYAITKADDTFNKQYIEDMHIRNVGVDFKHFDPNKKIYLDSCSSSMNAYKKLARSTDNDTAGYAAPQGLRNVLIMQGNIESWLYFISLRGCSRNTDETAYVTTLIWEELLKTNGGRELFHYAGPKCLYGKCLEGKMSCGESMHKYIEMAENEACSIPRAIINDKWPLLNLY